MDLKPKIVFSDFDGTLTHGCELVPIFFEILSLLKKHQTELVIVTGRSRAWAHFLLTHFPSLRAVIAEGGGVLVQANGHEPLERLLIDEMEVRRLADLTNDLLKEFPDLSLSTDSSGRLTDRAIPLNYLKANPEIHAEVCAFLKKENLNFSHSNVHLNYWAGPISKYASIEYFISNYRGDVALKDCIFFGDSLNDESCFQNFEHSVGVSNIVHILDELKYPPSEILVGEDKEGPYGVFAYLSRLFTHV